MLTQRGFVFAGEKPAGGHNRILGKAWPISELDDDDNISVHALAADGTPSKHLLSNVNIPSSNDLTNHKVWQHSCGLQDMTSDRRGNMLVQPLL